ncbi:MAG: ATP-binding cassette domain-containing protein, partial [Clostridia bacterium]|nr:ATP-binding cassette domain-containing protein [Clostridia bacterium]
LTVGEGEIHALLGENGAGKSTLMNILGGVLSATEGEILIDGKKVNFHNAKDSQQAGIRFVHQELNMFNDLMIYENMYIGEEITKGGILDRKKMIEKTRDALARIGLDLDPKTYIRDLSTARKQQLEIAKAVHNECKLLILDEPTTALTDKEINILFEIMRDLKAKGVSVIFITHKLPEVMAVCDKYTILRDGHFIANGLIQEITEHEISNMMVGRTLDLSSVVKPEVKEDPYFVVKDLCVGNYVKTYPSM